MKKISISHIRRWLVLLLVLVILTAIFTYLLTYLEIFRTLSSLATMPDQGSSSAVIEKTSIALLAGLKVRLLLLFSGGVFLIFCLGFIWIGIVTRRLSRPLRSISNGLSKIARGKLNETVNIETPDEYAQIATGINELAANLQELLLYIWKQSGQCLDELRALEADTTKEAPYIMTPARLRHLKQLHKAVSDLREMAKAYVFYDVHLEGEKTLAITKPGHTAPTEKDRATRNEL